MLPIEPIKASRINPRLLVIYGKSKCGKTTAASMLPNSLILDFEDGSDFVSALKVKILGLNSPSNESPESRQKRQDSGRYFINEVLLEIREFRRKNNRYPYELVIIDTGTRFEELCEDVATLDYMNSPQGSKFNRDQTGNILPKSQ